MPRELTDHIVEGDPSPQLQIEVTDEPGAGGANHRYEITGFDSRFNSSGSDDDEDLGQSYKKMLILFQNGPIQEVRGMNGITQEALLAIVIDRLKSFQAGPFRCQENEDALAYTLQALYYLQRRTRGRLERGVEGQTKP